MSENTIYKKLKSEGLNNSMNIIKEMSQEDKIMKSSNISNKEELKDKIHEIHNYLRNNGVGYGMNALKVFNLLYGLKKIEENNLLDKINLIPKCRFSYLLKLANENKDEELYNLIKNDVLDSINESSIKKLLFYEITHNIKSNVLSYLIKEIDKITVIEKTCNVLLSGKIYEYFIGRDESAISELGAYFTDRHIVDYIYSKLDPEVDKKGTIGTMIDMFGGSGGFTTGYINYLNEKYENINWKNNINNIYHYDMNEDVIKSAGLEFFCLTGVLPDMKDNLVQSNSFIHEFNDKKFKYVVTNPPYGGDKTNITEQQNKREIIKKYIKDKLNKLKDNPEENHKEIHDINQQLKKYAELDKIEKNKNDKLKVTINTCSQRIIKYALDNKLSGNDKESCSLILMMDMLEEGGTAVGVLKEGIFFNKLYKDIRKCLIEKFNVEEVISVPQDQFENTSTKTTIIIFNNTKEKTSKVIFSELIVDRYTENKIEKINNEYFLVEKKGDISNIYDKIISEATREQILNNDNISLISKDYNKMEIVCNKDYEIKKLGEICNTLPTTKYTSSIGKDIGKYRLYCSSQTKKLYVDFCEVKEESIIIGQGGQFNIHYDNNFTPSKHVCVLQHKESNTIILKYLYYIIPELQKSFIRNGSVISWLNKKNIKNLNIPIPKSEVKIKEWVDKISNPNNERLNIENIINETNNKIMKLIGDIEALEYEEVILKDICKFLPKSKRKAGEGQDEGEYNFYTSSDKVKKCNIADYKEECIIIGSGGVANIKIDSNFSCSADNFIIKSKYNKYIYNFIKNNMNLLIDGFVGSTLKHISKDYLSNIKIKIPKNKNIIKEIEDNFTEIQKLIIKVEKIEGDYNKQYIKELVAEAII